MDEQYFIDEELLNVLHECGMVKTEKELAAEKKLEEEAQKEEAEKKEYKDAATEECPVLQGIKDIKESLDTLNEKMQTFASVLKDVLLILRDND